AGSPERAACPRSGADPAEVSGGPTARPACAPPNHDSHAPLAEAALRAGKAVWRENPGALDEPQLDSLARTVRETNGFLSLGYNRRFSPHVRAIRDAFAGRSGPIAIQYTVAAGPAPARTLHVDPPVRRGRT